MAGNPCVWDRGNINYYIEDRNVQGQILNSQTLTRNGLVPPKGGSMCPSSRWAAAGYLTKNSSFTLGRPAHALPGVQVTLCYVLWSTLYLFVYHLESSPLITYRGIKKLNRTEAWTLEPELFRTFGKPLKRENYQMLDSRVFDSGFLVTVLLL